MDFTNDNLKTKILYLKDKLLNAPNLANGFIYEAPKPEDYEHIGDLGAVPKKEVNPEGDWTKFRPAGELQRRGTRETMACVTFSALNCIETLIHFYIHLEKTGKADDEIKEILKVFRHFDLIKNDKCDLSDRYIAKLSGTTSRGNTQHNVAQAIRHYGLVPESLWPYDIGDYYAEVPAWIINKGKEILKYLEFNHEWVEPQYFQNAGKTAPIQTAIHAYPGQDSQGRYLRTLYALNHAVDTDNRKTYDYHGIFDSYDPFDKKLVWNFIMGTGKVFSIHLLKPIKTKFEELLEKGHKYIIRPNAKGEFYRITKDGLEYIKDKDKIKEAISKETDLNADLAELTKQKKVIWVPEDYFKQLIS
jgi:hypothetical protein